MDVNYHYLLDLAAEMNARDPAARFLDYGCGKGEIVEAARKQGLQAYGTDIFYEANPDTMAMLRDKGLLGESIRAIRDARIPFGDGEFDVVASNMVFEHVEDMAAVLREIDRVLKPGGLLVALFPTREVWREAHTGIPFAHWWKKGSGFRDNYTLALRAVGFGTFKSRPLRKWVADMLGYLDAYVYYRPQKKIEEFVAPHFAFAWMERHHVAYRLRRAGLGWLAGAVNLPVIGWLARAAFTRAGFVVLFARKPGGANAPIGPAWLPRSFHLGRRDGQSGAAAPAA